MAIGGVAGGLLGALTNAGISEEDAQVFVEGVRRGGTLVAARVPQAEVPRIEAMMNQSAVNLGERRELYCKSGWQCFDPERRALYCRSGTQRASTACALADSPEFDGHQGRLEPAVSFSPDRFGLRM
jgi:hypothetical protein